MIKKSVLLVVCFTLALGIAQAVPARRPFGPPTSPDTFDFRDTQWFGKTYEGNDWTITFHADGKVTDVDGTNIHKNSGNWKATGNAIHMDLNNKYYEFRAILSADILHGDSSNVTGLRWKTTFKRMAATKIGDAPAVRQ